MQSAFQAPREFDLRPAVARLAAVHPGRVLIGRYPDRLHLSMLPSWRKDGSRLSADEPGMEEEPRVTVWAQSQEEAPYAACIRIEMAKLCGERGRSARDLEFLFAQRLNAVMCGMGLPPEEELKYDMYHVRSDADVEGDVLAISSAILGRIKSLVGYDLERKPMFASRPRGAGVPELSPRKRAGALREFGKRERVAKA